MPRGDQTGPAGMGPMTGRAAGYCAGYNAPGYMNPYGGGARGRAPAGAPFWGAGSWGAYPTYGPFRAQLSGFGRSRSSGYGFGRGRGGSGRGRGRW